MPTLIKTSLKVSLSLSQTQHLLNLKRKHKSSLVRDRAQAVLARNKGLTLANIAKALSRSPNFVKQAIKRFKKGGLEEIRLAGNNRKLSKKQRQEIIETIQAKCPKELEGFSFKTQFWTSDILKEVIKRKYQIEYKTDKSYYDIFKQAGFSFHKPKTKDFRQNPEKIKEFKGALKKSFKTTKIRLSW